MSGYAEQLLRRIEAIDTAAADNRRRAETYRQMASELKDVTAQAGSPDGAVTVVAGPGGEVKEVRFGDQIRGIAPQALAASVMQTIAAARAAAARRQAEVVRRGLGDTELLDRVLDTDERLFGDQRPADPDPGPVPRTGPSPVGTTPRTRPEPVYEDGYFDDFNVLGGGSAR
ncbi:YbaB/EbfC family nucleoid-associated protein [Amycolatopsis cynarae]|uniref:YbaB/EbfC family nucleoid-associated protein n=1 Tax=Amycolatopsis cynarae TaxID=2995223 RepID=A0ABY7AYY3_9PSEU|nr:YbaB/EbfC family nucleoid-associated protein [Amycolatopsis sp. HUAS 11-8]WAL64243.1 YbaB/EbfC family nucleoid-associated protein [Amycolatopsis sp. HUAS 11-8]